MNFNIVLVLKHVILCCVCIFGDKVTETVQKPALLRACIDNATHATIGCIAAEILLHSLKYHTKNQEYWFLLLIATVVSSLIDLDHFIEARSFRLQDATHLDRRPFLHNSAICVVTFVILILTKRLERNRYSLFISAVLIAFSTHHLRDATRRGIWIKSPFQDSSSPAVPYVLYLAFVNIIPHVLCLLLQTPYSTVPKMKLVEMV
ncbi:transmembrane protein 267 [Anopheles maculipalpis]|uniref:transmembrane protein 267 n=1 Tax=Anopheles maculipalpis TaxID=1496333 RepID=UPI002159931F|nr:transmembrane protein 267 [Anopheles maculipalpis]